eukprot:CAMPEP_0181111216 /NCGR_PEP_ID=MMETSP1071-20121207/19153_1 /TAXON_ID=35127 /ORGANISM="Thalassiosira sp., Strain NH16" /LENGTH=241 /DNA_ID=CAMNT_0023195087 /DNA_START=19 /DNA_END=744 /DNA_ORIENTATION=+
MSFAGFSSDFIDRLDESRRRCEEYAEANERRADSILADLRKVSADEQRGIDSLLRRIRSLRQERGIIDGDGSDGGGGGIAERRKRLEDKRAKLEQEVSMLESRNRVEQTQLEEVLAEEADVRGKADKVRARKEEIEMARGVTVEDLTKGLLNYRYTGLTFELGGKGALRFKFTKLDPEDHSRKFTYTLSMDDNNEYQLSDVNPTLDEKQTNSLLDDLNADHKNGFNTFVVGIRKLFKKTIQ